MTLRCVLAVCGTVLAVCGYFGPEDGGTLELSGLLLIAYAVLRSA